MSNFDWASAGQRSSGLGRKYLLSSNIRNYFPAIPECAVAAKLEIDSMRRFKLSAIFFLLYVAAFSTEPTKAELGVGTYGLYGKSDFFNDFVTVVLKVSKTDKQKYAKDRELELRTSSIF